MKQASLRRGAVAVHPGVALTLLVFLGLMAWGLVVNWFAIDPRVMGNQGLREKAVSSTISVSLSILGITGGVAAAAYFVFGKSMQAANIALMVLLILGSGLAGRRVYMLYDKIERRAQQAAGNGPSGTGSNGAGGGSGSASGSGPYVVPRAATPAPLPMAPSATQGGGSSPFGTGSAPAAPVTPTAQTPPLPVPAFDGKPLLEKLRVEFAAKCEALAVKAEAAYAAAAKPKKVNQFLDEWIEKFNTLKAEAEVLEAEIRELSMRGAREALERAGAPMGDAASQAIGFGEEFNTFQRQVACGEVSRFAERGAELFTIIKENLAKVQIDGKGEATSKDRAVETKLFHARSQLGFAVKRKDETLKKVRGKE